MKQKLSAIAVVTLVLAAPASCATHPKVGCPVGSHAVEKNLTFTKYKCERY